jgi:murein DD-endopeptidase MepM/ murein hydrolase activator NlpD
MAVQVFPDLGRGECAGGGHHGENEDERLHRFSESYCLQCVKPIFITWQDRAGRPKILRIPLWIVAFPLVTVVGLALALRLLWNSPWSPQRLLDRLEQTRAGNDRVESELRRGQEGLEIARKSMQLEWSEQERIRALAGFRPRATDTVVAKNRLFDRDSVPDVGALLAKARSIRQGYDQLIDWFQKHPTELSRLPTIRPVHADHPLVGDFGRQTDPFTGQSMNFPGLTWSASVGTPVWATGAGTVVATGEQPRWGKFVEIRHDDRVLTLYAHLSRIDVQEGASLNRGQVLGLSGTSGKVIAPAIFYAVFFDGEPIDPAAFLLPEAARTKHPAL